jgi:hypothetical protein
MLDFERLFLGVLAAQAEAAGLVALWQDDSQLSEEDTRRDKTASTWVVMTRQQKDLGRRARDPRWHTQPAKPGSGLWTDDYSNIFQVFSWR